MKHDTISTNIRLGPRSPAGRRETIERQGIQINLLTQENKNLQTQIDTDHLTGLHSRKYLDEQIDIFGQSGSIKGLTVIMFDADDFKIINDTLGHLIGDEILQKIATILKDIVESTDILARFGGDEMVLLCPNLIETDNIQKVLCRIHDALNDKKLKVSFGFSTDIKPDIKERFDFRDTLKKADDHLLQMKQYKNT